MKLPTLIKKGDFDFLLKERKPLPKNKSIKISPNSDRYDFITAQVKRKQRIKNKSEPTPREWGILDRGMKIGVLSVGTVFSIKKGVFGVLENGFDPVDGLFLGASAGLLTMALHRLKNFHK